MLKNGSGQDVFVFDSKLAKSDAANKKINLDRITDFSVPDGTIHRADPALSLSMADSLSLR